MRTIVNPRLLAEIDDEDRMEEGNYDNNYDPYYQNQYPQYPYQNQYPWY